MVERPSQAWPSMNSPAARSSVDRGSSREDIFFSPAAGRPSNDVMLQNARLNDAGNADGDPYTSCSAGSTRVALGQPLMPSMNDAEHTSDALQVDEADEDGDSAADNAGREAEEDDEESDVLYEDDVELAQLKRDFFFSQFVETPLQRFALSERRRLAALHDVLGRAVSPHFGRQCVGDILELSLRSTESTEAYQEDLTEHRNSLLRTEEGDKKLPYSAYSGLMDLFLALAGSGDEGDEPGNDEEEDEHVEEDGQGGDEVAPVERQWHHLPPFDHSDPDGIQARPGSDAESHQNIAKQTTLVAPAVNIALDHRKPTPCPNTREDLPLAPSGSQAYAISLTGTAEGCAPTVIPTISSPEVAPHYYLDSTIQHGALEEINQQAESTSLLHAGTTSAEKTSESLGVLNGVASATLYTDSASRINGHPASTVLNSPETAASQIDGNDSCCSPPLPAARESILMTASLSAPCTPLTTTATRLNTLGLSSACSKRTPI